MDESDLVYKGPWVRPDRLPRSIRLRISWKKDLGDKNCPDPFNISDRSDIRVLSEEGTSALRKHKAIRMANGTLDQGGLLTQEDLANIPGEIRLSRT